MDLKQKVEARRLERELEQTQIKLQQEKSEREAKERRELEKNKLEIAEKKREIEAWRLHKSQQEAPASNKTNEDYESEKESGSFAEAGEHIIDLKHDKDGNSSSQYNSWVAANGEDGMGEKTFVPHEKVLKAENRYGENTNVNELDKELFRYKLKSASFFVQMGYYLAVFMSLSFFSFAVMFLLSGELGGCFIFCLISIFFLWMGRSSIRDRKPSKD